MKYRDNRDGTFSIQAWEFTSKSGFNGYLYSQEILLDKMGSHDEYDVKLVWLVRDHAPLLGKEIS